MSLTPARSCSNELKSRVTFAWSTYCASYLFQSAFRLLSSSNVNVKGKTFPLPIYFMPWESERHSVYQLKGISKAFEINSSTCLSLLFIVIVVASDIESSILKGTAGINLNSEVCFNVEEWRNRLPALIWKRWVVSGNQWFTRFQILSPNWAEILSRILRELQHNVVKCRLWSDNRLTLRWSMSQKALRKSCESDKSD
jgi:hypothetical protein